MRIVDLHCDTISFLQEKNLPLERNQGQFDLQRAALSGVGLQFFAMFTRPDEPDRALRKILKQLLKFTQEIELNAAQIQPVYTYDDIVAVAQAQSMGAILHLEGAECLGHDLDLLHLLYRAGLRSIGPVWNARNQFAAGAAEADAGGGLSQLGRKLLGEMEQLGIVLDLAHMSKPSFYDALEFYSKPVMVTHANAFSLCPHPRNLDDEQLKKLAEHGGVIGITQVSEFVSREGQDYEALLDHMVHIAELIGVEYLALGSDFDGADDMIISEVGGYYYLPEMIQKRGFTPAETEKILAANALHILRQII